MIINCQNTNGITPKIRHLPVVEVTILTETHRKTIEKTKLLDHFSLCNIYQSDGERNSKGVTVLIKKELKDIPHTIHKISPTGNYITFSIEYNSEQYNIVGLYLEPEDYATAKLKNVMQEIDN